MHLYGQPADVERTARRRARPGLPLIEDAAQAHGATAGGRARRTLGDCAAFSFYPTKNLGALGDGGAVTTDNAELAGARAPAARIRLADARRDSELKGVNSRLDELQAALLRTLPGLDAANERRRRWPRPTGARWRACGAGPAGGDCGKRPVWHSTSSITRAGTSWPSSPARVGTGALRAAAASDHAFAAARPRTCRGGAPAER